MFIAIEAPRRELRQEFHVPVRAFLHFTPDGVSRTRCHYYKHCPPDGGPNHRSSASVKRSVCHRSHF